MTLHLPNNATAMIELVEPQPTDGEILKLKEYFAKAQKLIYPAKPSRFNNIHSPGDEVPLSDELVAVIGSAKVMRVGELSATEIMEAEIYDVDQWKPNKDIFGQVAYEALEKYWNAKHPEHPWDSNPWIIFYTFKEVKAVTP